MTGARTSAARRGSGAVASAVVSTRVRASTICVWDRSCSEGACQLGSSIQHRWVIAPFVVSNSTLASPSVERKTLALTDEARLERVLLSEGLGGPEARCGCPPASMACFVDLWAGSVLSSSWGGVRCRREGNEG